MCLLPAVPLFISLAIQESPPYSRQRRYKAKKGKGKKKTSLSVCFFFCRCCYSCKQKSRHPIIPVGERERQDPRQPASQPPPLPSKKKETELARISSIKSMDCCESTPLQVPLTVLHTRRCSVFPKLYPIPKLFSFFLSLCFCLPALPCHPQFETLPLKTLSGLAFLVCLSVLFRSLRPGARRHFSLFLSIPTPIYHETDRIVVGSSLGPPDQNEMEKETKQKRVHLDSRI